MGKIVAMARFVPKIYDKCKPFLESSKKSKEIERGREQDEALESIKNYLMTLSVLSALEPGEELYLYMAHSDVVMSGELFREQNGKQLPIFYISRMMIEAEKQYGAMEKLVLSLVCAKRKLGHYFKGHLIVVLTNQSLKAVLSKA